MIAETHHKQVDIVLIGQGVVELDDELALLLLHDLLLELHVLLVDFCLGDALPGIESILLSNFDQFDLIFVE